MKYWWHAMTIVHSGRYWYSIGPFCLSVDTISLKCWWHWYHWWHSVDTLFWYDVPSCRLLMMQYQSDTIAILDSIRPVWHSTLCVLFWCWCLLLTCCRIDDYLWWQILSLILICKYRETLSLLCPSWYFSHSVLSVYPVWLLLFYSHCQYVILNVSIHYFSMKYASA